LTKNANNIVVYFTTKVQQLAGMDAAQVDKGGKGESSKQVWFMDNAVPNVDILPLSKVLSDKTSAEGSTDKSLSEMLTCEDTVIHSTLSPVIFIPDDNIVNTQESAGVELGSQEDTIIESVKTVKIATDITLQESVHEAPVPVEEQVN
jgi:hypothetical protein